MNRITYNTRIEPELLKEFKILAIRLGVRQSNLMEEAIREILKKYESKTAPKKPSR
jgi:metal-responsive CopG/Arc/MetJ family transcriptional regulator